MKPINKKNFFLPFKGAGGSLGGARGRSSRPRRELKFLGSLISTCLMVKSALLIQNPTLGTFEPPLCRELNLWNLLWGTHESGFSVKL